MTDDEAARRSLRLKRINAKGLEVATRLSDLLANKDVTLADLEGLAELGRSQKEVRLRAYLDQINAARQRLLDGTPGVCLSCDVPLGDAVLDEQPWIERCSACLAHA